MGQEISNEQFSQRDREEYGKRLQAETVLLRQMLGEGQLSLHPATGGFEIEGWLVDADNRPVSCNAEFLQALDNPLATTELAKFNIELNVRPRALVGKALSAFAGDLCHLLEKCDAAAAMLGCNLLLIGILPSTVQRDFCLAAMSESHRYHALNHEILRARHHRPLSLDIDGQESLHIQHDTVMLEAATTSFQVHFQVPPKAAHHFYNAALVVSAPIMAVAGNAPFLFGHTLWQETRIPVFEQAVDAGREFPARVSFGSGFADKSILECFEENRTTYPVLLPELQDLPAAQFAHLRLHNGAIWRWNRPLVGFDEDCTPHIRLEHRILPAGPSVPDMIANAALFYGLVNYFGTELEAGEPLPMAFATARENFYNAARLGLDARLRWDRQDWPVTALLLEELLPLASAGLEQLGLDDNDIRHYLDVIAARTSSGQTGAVWQQHCLHRTGGDINRLLRAYSGLQRTHTPVHTWIHDC